MPYNGSDGTYTLSDTIAPATLADANELQAILDDIATALTTATAKDGQSTMTGVLKLANGSVSAPAWTFGSDPDSGGYRIGANNIGIGVNGAKVLDIATTGLSITGTFDATGNVAINTNKFTVTAASGNTLVAGSLTLTGDFAINTNKFTVTASSGDTLVAGTLTSSGALTVSSGGAAVTGNSTITGTLTVSSNLTVSSGTVTVPAGTIALAALVDDAKPGLVLLTSGTVTNAVSLDIPLTSYTGYRGIKIFLSGFRPATDDVELWMRFSTDGGVGYDSSAAQYSWGLATFFGDTQNGSDTKIVIAGSGTATQSVGNATTEGANVELTILNQTSTAFWTRTLITTAWVDAAAGQSLWGGSGSGARRAAQDTDAVQFLFESGNIAAGNYAVYGLR